MFVFRSGLKTFLAVCYIAVILSCDKKNDDVIYEKKVRSGKLDATFAWLDKEGNFPKANYMPVFYDFYQKTLNENNIIKAAHILEVVSSKKARSYSFDKKFVNTISYFVSNYAPKLPVEKTLFVNYYFCELYKDKGDFKTAISYNLKTTKISVTDYDSCLQVAYAFSSMSFCYYSIGNQNLAIKYNLQALTYFNKIQHHNGIGAAYNSLAGIYSTSKDYAEAEKYYDKAIYYFKKAKDLDNVFIALNNKIIDYDDSSNEKLNALVDSTYNYYISSGHEAKDTKIEIYSRQIRSLLYQNKLAEVKKIIDEIEPIIKEVNSARISNEFATLTIDYKIKNNEPIDIETLQKEIPYLIEGENYQELKIRYSLLKQNAVKRYDYKTAMYYEEMMTEASFALGKNTNSNKVIELDKKYQNQKKERQIAIQEKTIAYKNATIAWLAFAILIVFVVIVIYQSKQKQKRLEFEKQNAQLYTKQLLEKTEEERKRIASDLHDSVSHELLGLKNPSAEKLDPTNTKIDNIINDIRSISRNLHPIMFDKIGLKASVEQLTERAQSVNDFMVTSEINYEGSMATEKELQVYRIIQEAVSNVIKYADAMAAKITISEKDNTIDIEIKDNGKGFNVKEVLNGSKSFGLHNIIERSKAIGGKAKITSNNNGTTVAIQIKKTS